MFKLLTLLLTSVILSVIFFGYTDPNRLPVGFLMVPILLVFTNIYLLARIMLNMVPDSYFNHRKKVNHSILVASIAAFIVLFQSTGGIVWTDVILMGLLISVGYFYINRF